MSIAAPPTAPATPTVAIEHLTIIYRRRRRRLRVITDLSLSIRPGEAYGLVGESGCGKTTVAMALMRYLPPNAVVEAGRILFNGADVLTASSSTLRQWRGSRMAMVYQDPGSALNPTMRIGGQVAEVFQRHRGLSKGDALAAACSMLEKVQISDARGILRRYPHELSGGQQQRVMIAMALATNPDLLVLDEPTTGLDATVEAEVLDLIEALRAEFSTAILLISHNLGIVSRLCERVGVLYAGRLIEEGPARAILAQPRHPYALALLRCVPRLGRRKDAHRLVPIPGALPPLGVESAGCVYAPRCPLVRQQCQNESPPLETVGPERSSRCFFHSEVPDIADQAQAVSAPAPGREAAVLLKVDDLVQRYRSGGSVVMAVAGVSFEVRRGETFGLVGESGSGKSTLAKTIVGLLDPSDGKIELDSTQRTARHHRRDQQIRRKVQMVFQNPDTALNPRHPVRRILGRAITLLGDPASRQERRQQLLDLAAAVRLEIWHLGVRPAALSGGLKQRVAIARAFAGSPSLVLCDEPVSALDVSVQATILNLLVDLQERKGVSYVFISHDLAVVRYLADRIGVMYLGQLVDIGPADAVFHPPHHPYTEALLSAIPTLEQDGSRTRIRLQGTMPSPSSPPSGCRFHTRCPRFLGDVCREQEPPWQEDASGNRYRCHIPPPQLLQLQGNQQ